MDPSSTRSTQVCILVYGSDELLLRTRTMVLEQAGFRVFTAIRPEDAETIIKTRDVALVVLCHSLSLENRESLLEFANVREPALKTVVLTASNSLYPEHIPGAVLDSLDGPRKLVETVNRLLKGAFSPSQTA